MRHRTAFASIVICLLASLGLSSQALAVTNSDCDGSPYTNELALHEFVVDSPLSHKAREVGGISGGGLACGSDLTNTGDDETLIDHVTVTNPPGARTTNTSTVPVGSYVGEARVDVLARVGAAIELKNVNSPMYVDDLSVCESESQKLVGGPTPGQIIACYESKNYLVGDNWNWVALDGAGGSTFTVGPMYALGGFLTVALTRMQTDVCGYFGAIDGRSCGTSGVNVQRNGNVSVKLSSPNKCGANGTYSATATRRDGQVSQSVSSCVAWTKSRAYRVLPGGSRRRDFR